MTRRSRCRSPAGTDPGVDADGRPVRCGSAGRLVRTVRATVPSATAAAGALVGLWLTTAPASAHGGETTGPHDAPLAVGLFVGGVALVAVSVAADAREGVDVGRRGVDLGVFVGVAAVLVGIGAYWF